MRLPWKATQAISQDDNGASTSTFEICALGLKTKPHFNYTRLI